MEKIIEEKFLGFIFWEEGKAIDSKKFLNQMFDIMMNRNSYFKVFQAKTNKTYCNYEGLVFVNDICKNVTIDEIQNYFEEKLLERDKILSCY